MLSKKISEQQKFIELRKQVNSDKQKHLQQVIYERNMIAQLQSYQGKLISFLKRIAKVLLKRNITSDERIAEIRLIMKEVKELI